MPSTYTLNNGIELIGTGEQSGTWGDTTNTNLGLLDAALDGQVTVALASAGSSGSPNSLPITDGTASNGRNRMVVFSDSGDLGATAYVQLTPNDAEKIIYVRNSLSGSRSVILFQGTYNASNDYEVPAGTTAVVYFDGAGAGAVAANVFNNAYFDGLRLGSVSVTAILDEDNMASDSAAALATQQSIKAYVDSQVGTVDTLAEILAIGNTTGATDIAVDSAQKVQFRDAAIYINSSVDGQLDIVADTEIQIAATTIDVNGALDVSGTALVTGVLTTTAATVSNGGGQFNGAINVGVDDTGYDVKFFGATAGAYMLWDESADDLILGGAAGLSVNSTALVTGVLTTTAATVSNGGGQFNGAINVGVDDTGYDVKFFGATAGAYMLWDESADDLILGGAAGLSVNSAALVTGVLTTTAATVFNGGFASNANSSLSGSLAIGQTSFSGGSILLDLHGSGSSTGSQASFYNDHNTSGFQIGLAGNTSGDVIFYNVANTDMDFYTNNALRFSITNSEIVVNDQSADVDFRVESDTNTHALFVEGSSGNVGIGASSPAAPLSVYNASNPYANFADAANYFNVGVITSAYGLINSSLPISFQISDTERMGIDSSGGLITNPAAGGHAVFNEAGVDADFRVESDGNANMLFVDGGSNHVNIGTATDLAGVLNVDGNISLSGAGTDNRNIALLNETDAYEGSLIIQAGGVSAAFGGGIRLYGHSHASKPGDVVAGISAGSGGSFRVNTAGVDSGTDRLEVTDTGAFTTTPDAGGHAVFNEGGVDADFRVESDDNANMLFVDGNNNAVGIGTAAPESIVHIKDSGNVSTTLQIESAASQYAPIINFDGIVGASADYVLGEINGSWDTHTNIVSAIRFESGADTTNKDDGLISFLTSSSGPTLAERMRIDSSGGLITNPVAGGHAVFNEGGVDADFRVESEGYGNMLRVDASADVVYVGSNSSLSTEYLLHVKGSKRGARFFKDSSADGDQMLDITWDTSGYSTIFYVASSGTAPSASATAFRIGRNNTTSRSINASGTINASGADYAEYMVKADTLATINKGDVCGIDVSGKLTTVWADAISFAVKSTDPSYVGGDTWFNEDRPQPEDVSAEEYADFQTRLEAARATVDRIAFSGQVPVNVIGATVGDYIIPVQDETGITGQAVSSPTFEQYMSAVGKVIAIEDDGRAKIIVKVA
jgi:hypothetical protein